MEMEKKPVGFLSPYNFKSRVGITLIMFLKIAGKKVIALNKHSLYTKPLIDLHPCFRE